MKTIGIYKTDHIDQDVVDKFVSEIERRMRHLLITDSLTQRMYDAVALVNPNLFGEDMENEEYRHHTYVNPHTLGVFDHPGEENTISLSDYIFLVARSYKKAFGDDYWMYLLKADIASKIKYETLDYYMITDLKYWSEAQFMSKNIDNSLVLIPSSTFINEDPHIKKVEENIHSVRLDIHDWSKNDIVLTWVTNIIEVGTKVKVIES